MKKILTAGTIVITMLLLLSACNSDKESTNGSDSTTVNSEKPEKVTQAFFTALNQRNFPEAKKHATKESAMFMNMLDSFMKSSDNARFLAADNFKIDSVDVKGDSAYVRMTKGRKKDSMKVNLVKEEGSWKVAVNLNELMTNVMNDSLQKKDTNIHEDIHKGIDSLKKRM